MAQLSLADANLLFAYVIAVVGLLTLGLLWRLRGGAVYLWSAGILLQSLAAALIAVAGERRPAPWLMGGLVLAALGSNLAKMHAVRRVVGLPGRWQVPVVATLVLATAVVLLEAQAAPWVPVFSLVVVGTVLSMVLLAQSCSRAKTHVEGRSAVLIQWLTLGYAALLLLSLAGSLLSGQDPMDTAGKSGTLGAGTFVLLLPVTINMLFIRLMLDQHLRHFSDARQQAAQAELARGRFEERERLLSDIHDGFGSLLATARVRLQRGDASASEAAQLLDECLTDLQLTVDTLQEDGDSLAADFSNLRYRYQQRLAGSRLVITWDLQLAGMPTATPTLRLQVLRIVQEAISNALRHGQADTIRIAARWDATQERLLASVEDDGVGLPPQLAPGRGLANMQRRARVLGARLGLESGAGGVGARLWLEAPVAAATGHG